MAVTQGVMIKSFVSAIDFLDQRDIDPNIYDVTRDKHFTNIMKLVNRYKPATMYYYHQFVNQNVWEVGTISAVTSTGLAQIQFTINTAATYPREGDLIKTSNVNNIGRQGRVQAVTFGSGTATLTVRSVGGNAAPLFATIGDTIQFGSNAFAEKSTAPVNRRYGLTKYYNLIQTFREVDEISDIQKVAKIEVNVGGDYHILPYQIVQKYIKFEGDISVQMFCGTQSTTLYNDTNPFLADPTTGLPIQTTGGVDWYIQNYGIVDSAAVLGTFGFTEIDEMCDNLIAAKAPKDRLVFLSSRSYGLISKFLKNLASSGVTSVRLNIDGVTLNFEVEQFKYRGFTFEFVPFDLMDMPQLFSATLLADINGSLYDIPKGQIDTVENGMQPYLQIRHTSTPFKGSSANKSANGMVTEWRTGALAEIPTDDTMQLRTNWTTAQGLEAVGVNFFQKYRVI